MAAAPLSAPEVTTAGVRKYIDASAAEITRLKCELQKARQERDESEIHVEQERSARVDAEEALHAEQEQREGRMRASEDLREEEAAVKAYHSSSEPPQLDLDEANLPESSTAESSSQQPPAKRQNLSGPLHPSETTTRFPMSSHMAEIKHLHKVIDALPPIKVASRHTSSSSATSFRPSFR
ncbi:hypothetical protein C8R46DRAFT_1199215, partial [Mycena filopes]